jgi:hypothetical protein
MSEYDIAAATQLIRQVDAEQFFAKMAELGYAPHSEQDAIDMLETSFAIERVESDPSLVKQAVGVSLYGAAKQDLLKLAGVEPDLPVVVSRQRKQAAEAYLENPQIAEATLSLLLAQAQG